MKVLIMGKKNLIMDLLSRFLIDEGCEILGAEQDPDIAIQIICQKHPDIVLIDAKESFEKELIFIVKSLFPQQKIVVLSHFEKKEEVLLILSMGVNGYLLKSSHQKDIIEALIAINKGETRISPQLYNIIFEDWQKEKRKKGANIAELTKRELEVLSLIAEGKTNKEISTILFISPNTVKCHVSSITTKLNAKSRTDAVFKSYSIVNKIKLGY